MSDSSEKKATSFLNALIAGGMAGTSVDVALFPIDTLKTRLQAPQGFIKAGGFTGIYNGLGAAAVGSAPGAALFFSTYEIMKPIVYDRMEAMGFKDQQAATHMIAASMGETMACLVRVPTEVVKAKMQTSGTPLVGTFQQVLKEKHGSPLAAITGGLYRGYGVTIMREIPFAMIQFPMYERFKVMVGDWQKEPASALQAAACGSVSGGIAAAVTTPLDVIKTRLMLGADAHGVQYNGMVDVIQRTHSAEGTAVFLSGIQPRVMWISIGGFVFFGAYEAYKRSLSPYLD
uniref:S-adenosylmethionine transporter n=1 Tax=Craspedostauros australis TaxID=1486917 RepID=A0A7R9WMN4_9STRA|mmetsp:Transcript_12461/g.34325  ORF Transcript_12461/g.34325 Transcript_12461/m.34325 type:complete len:288 (+) Transcript_12461:187-1050(+)